MWLVVLLLPACLAVPHNPNCADDNEGLGIATQAMGQLTCLEVLEAYPTRNPCHDPVDALIDLTTLLQEFCQFSCEICTPDCDSNALEEECELPEADVSLKRFLQVLRIGEPLYHSSHFFIHLNLQLMTPCHAYRAFDRCAIQNG